MALDPDFFISPNIQENFTDKDTGFPLVNGKIFFFEDEARTTTKDVFVLTGTPPNYSYTNIGHTVTLNNAGSTSYLGTDVRLYYYPFDENGVTQLYFVRVESATGVEQETREAWPNILGASSTGDNGDSAFSNYIPNGQFGSHNDLPDDGVIAGEVTQIAYGNWTFERPVGSDATDAVTFTRFASYVDNPESHPRHALKVINTGGGSGDLFKDARVKFDDVSKFGSDTQQFTFKFSARSLSGTVDLDLVLIKNYGTGGSLETETSIENFSIGGSYQSFVAAFAFGDNATKTIGPSDDDFIQLAIRYPIGSVFDVELTNFTLVEGAFAAINFPDTTTRQSVSQYLGGAFPVPDPTGLDLYLQPRLTPTGWEFDRSDIGNPFFKFMEILEIGELWANGESYVTADKSAEGIPFLRLQQKYFDATTRTAVYGTGVNNLTVYSPGETGNLATFSLVSNDTGIAIAAADGATATGFTFNLIYTGVATSNSINSWVSTAGNGYMQLETAGIVNTPGAGTSGLSIATNSLVKGTSITPEEFDVIFDTAVALQNPGGNGKYWEYDTPTGDYYVWYSVTDEVDPAVGGRTGIQVGISINDDAITVAEKTIFALSNTQSSYIETVDASSITSNSYFEASIPSEDFYVWYAKDGAGTDPNVSNKTGIQVDILGADNAQAVAEKTQTTINSRKFAVPDARELMFRGAAMGRNDIGLDEDQLYRFSRANVKFGATQIGSEQLSVNRSHIHGSSPASAIIFGGANLFGGNTDNFSQHPLIIDEEGRTESRPANMYVGVAIKY